MKIDNKKVYEIYEVNQGLTRKEKGDVCNALFGTSYGESAFRKRYDTYKDALQAQFSADEEYEKVILKEINVMKQQKKTVIMRSTVNKVIRNKAFGELIQDEIVNVDFPQYKFKKLAKVKSSDEWHLLSIADYHYDGWQDIEGFFNEVYNIVVNRGLKELTIFSLGDEIEGLLRVSASMDSKIGAVKQMRAYAVHFLNFLQELSKEVKLTVYQVESANHSETRVLGTGRGELEEDLLEFLTAIVSIGLKGNPNVEFIFSKEIHTNIGGFNFYIEHGHKAKGGRPINYITKKLVDKNLSVDYYYMAHIHHYVNETLHARDGYDLDYTAVPSCKPGISRYEDGLNLSSNSAVLLEKFNKNGRVSTEKIILTNKEA